jgi:peptidoglycan/LPS O-acetylase OafA/YrhL
LPIHRPARQNPQAMPQWMKFLALVIILNVARYLLGAPLEMLFIFKPLSAAMQSSSAYFNQNFTTFDWTTSFFYNFMMWLTVEGVFVLMSPVLKGNWYVRSLKVYGLMLLLFVSVAAILMNHYSHPKAFYLWIMADAVIVYGLVGLVNGFLYPRIMGRP